MARPRTPNMTKVAHACLGILLASGSPVLQAGCEAGITRETMAECSGVFRVLASREKYDIKVETGTAIILNEDYSRLEVQGCVVVALGDYPVDGIDLPPDQVVRNYFLAKGWQMNIDYLADGPGSGQSAYRREVGHGGGTLCISQWLSDAVLDAPPTYQSVRVTCVDSGTHLTVGE